MSSFLLFHFLRTLSGKSCVMPFAKSAFMTTRSAKNSPLAVRTPLMVFPSMITDSTASFIRNVTPRSLAMLAMRSLTLPRPPIGWKIPYSYSKKASMVNKLGQLNGDMPRYLVWKDMASMRPVIVKEFHQIFGNRSPEGAARRQPAWHAWTRGRLARTKALEGRLLISLIWCGCPRRTA